MTGIQVGQQNYMGMLYTTTTFNLQMMHSTSYTAFLIYEFLFLEEFLFGPMIKWIQPFLDVRNASLSILYQYEGEE